MASSLLSPTSPQIKLPQQTFLDKKPPLLPRQSTSDVLSFTRIIADRLLPGQNVWDFFSPPPVAPPFDDSAVNSNSNSNSNSVSNGNNTNSATANATLAPLSPTSPGPQSVSMAAMAMMSPTSPLSPTFGQFPVGTKLLAEAETEAQTGTTTGSLSKRNSIASSTVQERTDFSRINLAENSNNHNNNNNKADPSLPPLSTTASPVSPSSPSPTGGAAGTAALPPAPPVSAPTSTTWSTPAGTISTSGGNNNGAVEETETPKLQKRRSFAQSLKHGMLSLTQMLSPSPSTASSRMSSPMTVNPFAASSVPGAAPGGGPPHYNILVLGSDSAPLASTLYKMSSLLPSATKIRHYQEISGFFVAYFRSDGSFSCSPTMTPTTPTAPTTLGRAPSALISSSSSFATGVADVTPVLIEREGIDEVKSRRGSIQDSENDDLEDTRTLSRQIEGDEDPIMKLISARSSEETLLQLKISSGGDGTSSSCGSTAHSVADMEREEVLLSEDECDEGSPAAASAEVEAETETEGDETEQPNASANASLSVHAFNLDTTWPVPRVLAQTFWFPFAHGIIYIVDATRKNDPRGIDHLLNARQFLASLVADTHFRRKDIPVVVFANKAGLDPETCYRVDEIAEILGCEDWDLNGSGSDGEGSGGGGGGRKGKKKTDGLRGGGGGDAQSIGGRKSVEGGVVEVDASGAFKTRPWCVKSTRCDGAGDGLRESVEWLKSRMGETWKP